MEDAIIKQENLAMLRKNMLEYFETHDPKFLAEDCVFIDLSAGREYRGKAEVTAMLQNSYKVAFEARLELKNYLIEEDKAFVEGFFKGKHIGEFFGVQPTYKFVNAPLCITYHIEKGLIKSARIYMVADILRKQLGVGLTNMPLKTTYVTRDIFYLKFGHYREVKALLEDALNRELMPEAKNVRVLTDFTGKSYRLIFEEGYDHLGDYEISLNSSMHTEEWQQWYAKFKHHIEGGEREILKQVI
jgi:hypothetical protein